MKNRFFLFSYQDCYPSGGLEDVIKKYDTNDEALKDINDKVLMSNLCSSDNWYLWDRLEDKIVLQTDNGHTYM
jgi:hypothetical protein